jgi:hypothetical protein
MCGELSNCFINDANAIFQYYSSKTVNMGRILQSLNWIQHIYEPFFTLNKNKTSIEQKIIKVQRGSNPSHAITKVQFLF